MAFFVHKDLSNGSKMDFPSSFIEQKSAAPSWTQSRCTLKAGLFVLHSQIDRFHLHPQHGVIPYIISSRHMFAFSVMQNNFSRLTSGGANEMGQKDRGGAKGGGRN